MTIMERINDPDWWVEFVVNALTEAGVPDPDVWHEDGLLYAESCGDCTCGPEEWRTGNCGPTTAQEDQAFDLLNTTVNRLIHGSTLGPDRSVTASGQTGSQTRDTGSHEAQA